MGQTIYGEVESTANLPGLQYELVEFKVILLKKAKILKSYFRSLTTRVKLVQHQLSSLSFKTAMVSHLSMLNLMDKPQLDKISSSRISHLVSRIWTIKTRSPTSAQSNFHLPKFNSLDLNFQSKIKRL